MPTPNEGESKDDFMSRCMGDDKMVDEFGNPQQRAAVCNSYFEKKDATAKMEDYIFSTPEGARKKSREIGFDGEIHESKMADGTIMYFPAKTEKEFIEWYRKNDSDAEEELTALQYGKPGKNDPRKTPAKPSERRKGSKKNPPGSAKKPNKNIKTSEGTEARLRKLMTEHNKKNKGSKASMGMLKTVFRRGTGAFSRSHAPNMSRSGWGIARVKAFLYLLRNGRPSNPNYKQDNDLLPKGHPRAKKADEEYEDWDEEPFSAAEYQGRKVTLNKPFRTPGESKKFAVYTKNASGTVVIVRFGDPNMEIKRDDPQRRKNFRSRHNCDNPGPKWKARYWSCYQWRSGAKVKSDEDIDKSDDSVLADMSCGCGSDCCNEEVEAAVPSPKDDESHSEFMSRCQEMGYSEDECMKAHENHEFMEESMYHEKEYYSEFYTCPPGEEMRGGECQRVAVTLDIDIQDIETTIIATTGETLIRISGTAFHEGVNKNSWGIREELAERLADEMIGADVTLNHPKAEMGRFKRNMDGGVDEAVVGEVVDASYHKRAGGYIVKYAAVIKRRELFEALESGLWMKPGYGVSIGGTGVPTEVIEAEKSETGRPIMWFAEDFKFDHLAIVHKPAYKEANIETVERVKADENFKYQTASSVNQSKVKEMTEDINETENLASEIEALKASLVLKDAQIAEFEASELAREEESRMELVRKASDLGLSGHDDFSKETLTTMIASWEASRPAPVEEKVVEMSPVEASVSEAPVEEATEEPVVANYLNGVLVESSESLYARCYNSWVNAYNGFIASDESPALTYEELKN